MRGALIFASCWGARDVLVGSGAPRSSSSALASLWWVPSHPRLPGSPRWGARVGAGAAGGCLAVGGACSSLLAQGARVAQADCLGLWMLLLRFSVCSQRAAQDKEGGARRGGGTTAPGTTAPGTTPPGLVCLSAYGGGGVSRF